MAFHGRSILGRHCEPGEITWKESQAWAYRIFDERSAAKKLGISRKAYRDRIKRYKRKSSEQ